MRKMNRSLSLVVLAMTLGLAAPAKADNAQDSARVVKTVQNALPGYEASMKQACGASVTFQIDWASFGTNTRALANLQYQGVDRTAAGVLNVCKNDLIGQRAIAEQVHQIVIRNVGDASTKSITIGANTMTITAAYAIDSGGYFTDSEVSVALDRSLTVAVTGVGTTNLGTARMISTLQRAVTPYETAMKNACKAPITFHVDWASFATDRPALLNVEYQAVERAELGVVAACKSGATVQQRVAKSVQVIVIRNIPQTSKRSTFAASGTLTIQAPYAVDGAYFTETDVERWVEHSL